MELHFIFWDKEPVPLASHTSKEKPEVIEKFVIGVRGRKWS